MARGHRGNRCLLRGIYHNAGAGLLEAIQERFEQLAHGRQRPRSIKQRPRGAQRGRPDTGQARMRLAAQGKTRLRQRLILGAGRPNAQAGAHPTRGHG